MQIERSTRLYGLAGFDGEPVSEASGVWRDVVRRGVFSCINGSCSCESRGEVAMIERDSRVSECLSTRDDAIGRLVQAEILDHTSKRPGDSKFCIVFHFPCSGENQWFELARSR